MSPRNGRIPASITSPAATALSAISLPLAAAADPVPLHGRAVESLHHARHEALLPVEGEELLGLDRVGGGRGGAVVQLGPERADHVDPPVGLLDRVLARGAEGAGAAEAPVLLEVGVPGCVGLKRTVL